MEINIRNNEEIITLEVADNEFTELIKNDQAERSTDVGHEVEPRTPQEIIDDFNRAEYNDWHAYTRQVQKGFTVDFLTKKKKRNEGEVPQYYVTGSHEAIIDPEIWELTQARLAAQTPVSHSRPTSYEGLLVCTFCGSLCGSKIWHSTSKYRSIRWQCNKKYQIQHPPRIPAVRTERLDEIWWNAYNQLVKKTKAIDFDLLIEVFADESKLAEQLELLEVKRARLEAEATALVDEASRQVVDVDKNREAYARLEFEHAKTIDEINQAKQTQASSVAVARLLKQMRRDGYKQPTAIDYRMVHVLTDRIEITATGEVTVIFKNGYRVQDRVKK